MKEFYMLYRDGGGAPTYRHPSIKSASDEARRLADELGGDVWILETVSVESNSRPTDRQIAAHAKAHPYGSTPAHPWGLWRVSRHGMVPAIVCARCQTYSGGEAYLSMDTPYSGLVKDQPREWTWVPLDAKGNPIQYDDIPF